MKTISISNLQSKIIAALREQKEIQNHLSKEGLPIYNKIEVVKGDITKIDVEAIVNSAHPSLLAGSGVSGAIHQAAGKKLEIACKEIRVCVPGEAVLTPGYGLKAKYIIHTVVPHAERYSQISDKDKTILIQCYKNSIKLANEYKFKTLAFPSLGTGVRGFPLQETAELAIQTVVEYLKRVHPSAFNNVYFVMNSDESYKVYKEALISIKTDDITDLTGDVIIIPCDSELTYTKSFSPNPNYPLFTHESKKGLIKSLLEKAGKELVRELTAIGYCEVGYAVVTQGYDLKTKHIIFMPISDHNNEEVRTNYIGLHQSLRAAFDLANLYKARSVAISGIYLSNKRKGGFASLWDKYFTDVGEPSKLSSGQIEDIIISTFNNLNNSSVKELSIYKYSK